MKKCLLLGLVCIFVTQASNSSAVPVEHAQALDQPIQIRAFSGNPIYALNPKELDLDSKEEFFSKFGDKNLLQDPYAYKLRKIILRETGINVQKFVGSDQVVNCVIYANKTLQGSIRNNQSYIDIRIKCGLGEIVIILKAYPNIPTVNGEVQQADLEKIFALPGLEIMDIKLDGNSATSYAEHGNLMYQICNTDDSVPNASNLLKIINILDGGESQFDRDTVQQQFIDGNGIQEYQEDLARIGLKFGMYDTSDFWLQKIGFED